MFFSNYIQAVFISKTIPYIKKNNNNNLKRQAFEYSNR